MCLSTVYEDSESGPMLAEYITQVVEENGTIILTDIMGKETAIRGRLKLADLTRGILLIAPTPVTTQVDKSRR